MSQPNLFKAPPISPSDLPLAEILRPKRLDQVVGQAHLTGENGMLTRMVQAGRLPCIIMWGPPGCGKTTIARLLADEAGYVMQQVSAVTSGVAALKQEFETARARAHTQGDAPKRSLLFIDEIHRFTRAQQDVLLPVMEDGTITVIGATTENPSFSLNAALLSRARVLTLNRLDDDALDAMLREAEAQAHAMPLTADARALLLRMADGDGRFLLSIAESLLVEPADSLLDESALLQMIERRPAQYDRAQDTHYNLMSALHKSLRGSDVNAALYWFARMLEGGEDMRYITRRLIRFAVEDIGMAEPQALIQAQAADSAYQRLGSPEGELAVAQSVIYLAMAPKSNAQYSAFKLARKSAKEHGSLMPPKHILNAPTSLMKDLGYGKGYAYDHDEKDGFSGQNYFPDEMAREAYYQPKEIGFERDMQKRLQYFDKLRVEKNAPDNASQKKEKAS
jgi:putative ATPase